MLYCIVELGLEVRRLHKIKFAHVQIKKYKNLNSTPEDKDKLRLFYSTQKLRNGVLDCPEKDIINKQIIIFGASGPIQLQALA